MVAAIFFSSCSGPGTDTPAPAGRIIRVVTTATMVQDMVEAVGGDRVAVDNLVEPGVDPHHYHPSIIDISRVNRTEGVFHLGLNFGELVEEVLEQKKKAGQKVFVLSDSIPPEKLMQTEKGMVDPHIWLDAELWSHCVDAVLSGLIELDPEKKPYYEQRAEAYRAELKEVHAWALRKVEELPPGKRVLITSHDAFSYFGRAYGFEAFGLAGTFTASEPSRVDFTRLTNLIEDREIRAVFAESTVSSEPIERLIRDSGAVIGGELFSDALAPEGSQKLGFDVGSYPGMLRYNLTTIVEALQ